AGKLPSEELMSAMGRYNEELKRAGVLLDMDGLHPSSQGVRVSFAGGKTTVTDGPFAEAKELLAGYWMIQVGSKEEAIEWAKRIPFGGAEDCGEEAVVEIRRVFELSDFPPCEAIQQEARLKEQLSAR
ncbi:MAG TPA: YciI family protein, partial [Armatimonadota bacterium]